MVYTVCRTEHTLTLDLAVVCSDLLKNYSHSIGTWAKKQKTKAKKTKKQQKQKQNKTKQSKKQSKTKTKETKQKTFKKQLYKNVNMNVQWT